MRDESNTRAVHVNIVGDIAIDVAADITESRKRTAAERR